MEFLTINAQRPIQKGVSRSQLSKVAVVTSDIGIHRVSGGDQIPMSMVPCAVGLPFPVSISLIAVAQFGGRQVRTRART